LPRALDWKKGEREKEERQEAPRLESFMGGKKKVKQKQVNTATEQSSSTPLHLTQETSALS